MKAFDAIFTGLAALISMVLMVSVVAAAWANHSPATPAVCPAQTAYVVSAGEFELCNSVCKYRTRTGVKEVWRGAYMSLNCVCDGMEVSISGKSLGKGL